MSIGRAKLPSWHVATALLALVMLFAPPILWSSASLASPVSANPQSLQHLENNDVIASSDDEELSGPASEPDAIPVDGESVPAVPVNPSPSAAIRPAAKAAAPPRPRPRKAGKRRIRTMTMIVTAYCPCSKCCGQWADGRTASGKSIWHNQGRFVAADKRVIPFFKKIRIPGYNGGKAVPVLDTGRRIRGNRLDVFFHSHTRANRWASRRLTVEVLE